jgi:serine phosphatase RsbU (regulator of sigma subunit)
VDSLELQIERTGNRRKKVDLINELAERYQFNDPDKCFRASSQAYHMAEEIGYEEGIAKSCVILGDYFLSSNLVDSSLNNYNMALSIYKGLTDDKKTGEALFKIGSALYLSSNYKAALPYATEALDIFEITGDQTSLAKAHSLLCDIESNMGFRSKAIDHCLQSLRLYESLNANEGRADLLNSIGNIYLKLGQYEKCEQFFNEAMYLSKEVNDLDLTAESLVNIGNLKMEQENFDDAIPFYKRALEMQRNSKNTIGQAYTLYYIGLANRSLGQYGEAFENMKECYGLSAKTMNLELQAKILAEYGNLYSDRGKYETAIDYLKQSLAVAQKIGSDPILLYCYNNLAKYYDRLNDKENALIYLKLYILYREEVFANQSSQKIAETEVLYNLEKKEQQIQLLRSQNRIKDLEASERNLMNIWLFTGLIFVFAFSVLLYKKNLAHNKANLMLQKQKSAINNQKVEIEHTRDEYEKLSFLLAQKNKEVTDSIEYAQRIQHSMIQGDEIIFKNFSGAFIFYRPKDIVSGDFYWIKQKSKRVYVAAIDCTGHGVPGAFMTVLGNTLMNQILDQKEGDAMPDEVLYALDKKVKENLNQHGISLSAFEGMDMALICLDMQALKCYYSGAKMPLYYYHAKELQQVKGNRHSIGGNDFSEKRFDLKEIELEKGDQLYLSSDGFQDQFGGANGKKFMKLHFRGLIGKVATMPMDMQKDSLISKFDEWKGDHQQTDDVLVIGIKI